VNLASLSSAPRNCFLLLLTLTLCGCKDSHVRALAGTYVSVYDESGPGVVSIHSRTALTLRDDNRWTSASELVVGGQDQLAGGRVRDVIIPPGYVDSGTFALNGLVLAVNSARDGVSQYTVSGDTLWTRNADRAALATAVTGLQMQRGSEGFLVRQR
jgi:hypothetical protein